MRGRPIIVLTSVGAKLGTLRKIPLMRVEHEGEYVVVASLGGAPKHPTRHHNLKTNPHVELQDGPVKKDYEARELGANVTCGGSVQSPPGRITSSTRRRRIG